MSAMGDQEQDIVGSVIVLQLSNGKTLIGVCNEQNDDGFVLGRPLEVHTAIIEDNLRVGFANYLTCNGLFDPLDEVTVTYDQIVLPRTVPDKLEASYREATGMVQVPPQPSIIIPGQ